MQMSEAADVAIDNLSTLKLDEERGSSTSRRNEDDERNEENDDVEEEQTKKASKRKKEQERLKNIATHSIQALLNCGNDVNEITSIQANTALHRAAARAQADVTQSLLKAGADVTKTNCNGWTPLHAACFSTRDPYDVVDFAMQMRTSMHIRERERLYTWQSCSSMSILQRERKEYVIVIRKGTRGIPTNF